MSVTFLIYLIPTFKIYISRKRCIIFHRKISYNSIFHWQAYVSECLPWFRVCMACLPSPKTYTDIPSPSSCHKPTQQPFGGNISRESLAQSCESKRQYGGGNVLVMPWIYSKDCLDADKYDCTATLHIAGHQRELPEKQMLWSPSSRDSGQDINSGDKT